MATAAKTADVLGDEIPVHELPTHYAEQDHPESVIRSAGIRNGDPAHVIHAKIAQVIDRPNRRRPA